LLLPLSDHSKKDATASIIIVQSNTLQEVCKSVAVTKIFCIGPFPSRFKLKKFNISYPTSRQIRAITKVEHLHTVSHHGITDFGTTFHWSLKEHKHCSKAMDKALIFLLTVYYRVHGLQLNYRQFHYVNHYQFTELQHISEITSFGSSTCP